MLSARWSVIACVFLGALFFSCSSPTSTTEIADTEGSNVELGVPQDSDSSDDYIINRVQYSLSYNKNLNVANWVSWNEDSAWYGSVPRCDCFKADPLLPSNFTSVGSNAYVASGYDRGHLCPSEPRTRSDSDNANTFYMSNIWPQTGSLNQQTWAYLESYCDSLCTKANKERYIIAGGIYRTKNRVNGLVTIPDSCWKVVVVMDKNTGLSKVNSMTRVIAVCMANRAYTKDDNEWQLYTTTVRRIEQSTGYDLLSKVPKSIQDIIELR